jgi:preprotein translocase subunit SecE
MAQTSTRRNEAEQEQEYDPTEIEAGEGNAAVTPAVSDSRRRRQRKAGFTPTEAAPAERKERAARPAERPTRSTGFFGRVIQYFREVRNELQRVAWPTREEAQRLTYIVLVATTISALFLGAVSAVFNFLVTQVASNSMIGLIAAIVVIIVVTGGWVMRDRFFGPTSE